MKKKAWITIGILALLGVSYYFIRNLSQTDNITFETTSLARGELQVIISGSGTLNATNTVDVGTQVSGVIEKVMVDFNDQVKKGQVIAQIDARNLESTVQQMQVKVLQAELQCEQKKRAYEFARQYNSQHGKDLTVVEAEASVEQIRTQMELAERNYERYKDLFERGVVSRVEFETKDADYQRLNANYESVNAMLNRTKANVSNVDLNKSLDDFKNAEAGLASAKADLKKAQINLNYATIRTPIDGIVISRDVEVGQTVAASFATPILFAIANDLTQMEIEASIDEADIGMIQDGQSVTFTVDAYPDETFEGRVEQIRMQPQIISNVVTYMVIVSTNNASLKLMPGMTANLDITTAQRQDVIKVPVRALNFIPPDEYLDPWKEDVLSKVNANNNTIKTGVVWKVDNNEMVPITVNIGLSDGSYTEISSNEINLEDKVLIGLMDSSKSSSKSSNLFMPSRPRRK